MIESTQRDDGIAIVTLAYGKANVMDIEFCTAVADCFEAYATAPPSALVVTGQGRMFSAGVWPGSSRWSKRGKKWVRSLILVILPL